MKSFKCGQKKMSCNSFENKVTKKHLLIKYIFRQDLELNNQQWLIYNKTPTNQNKSILRFKYGTLLTVGIMQVTSPHQGFIMFTLFKHLGSNSVTTVMIHLTSLYIQEDASKRGIPIFEMHKVRILFSTVLMVYEINYCS